MDEMGYGVHRYGVAGQLGSKPTVGSVQRDLSASHGNQSMERIATNPTPKTKSEAI